MSKRRKFTDYEKKTIYEKYNGRCAICGEPIGFKNLTLNHKVPLSKGGTNEFENLQLACRECNLMKKGLTEKEFQKKVRKVFAFHVKHMFLKGGAAV